MYRFFSKLGKKRVAVFLGLSVVSDQVGFPDETHVRLNNEPSQESMFHRLKYLLNWIKLVVAVGTAKKKPVSLLRRECVNYVIKQKPDSLGHWGSRDLELRKEMEIKRFWNERFGDRKSPQFILNDWVCHLYKILNLARRPECFKLHFERGLHI